MGESYSERERAAAAETRGLLARLLPGVDADLLLAGLQAEREGSAAERADVAPRHETELAPPARELRRVRAQFVLGETVRMVQHAISNPLTALLAEAQLLELEELPDDQRQSVVRIVGLARRLVTLTQRLDGAAEEGTRDEGRGARD
jgi:signal transduction histidine kinase